MSDRNLRRGEANVIGVYALGFVLGGLGVFIGCGDPSADDDADVGDDVVSDVDILPDVDVPIDVDDDVAEADGDTVVETEIAPVCGNGILEDGEECDDGNDVGGDGCEPETCVFSCHEDDDCLEIPEDDPCTVNSCEEVTGGQVCRSVPNEGASCHDGLFCTGTDTCDASGTCVSSGDPCPASCTVCNEDAGTCDVAGGSCWIDGACHADGAANPGNPCRYCDAVGDREAWSNRAAGTSCDDGVFCNGTDTCDSSGACGSTGDPCPETCRTCNESDDRCDVTTGCWIADGCRVADEANPANQCEWCRPATSTTAWTDRPDFTPCSLVTDPDYSYDICARGACVSPGSCGTAACNAPGPNWTIPDTNQRFCYDDSTTPLASCPGTAGSPTCSTTPFCGQDWQHGWDTENDASARFTRTGTTEPIVTDNVTGLVWQGCSSGQSGSACTGTALAYTWAQALAFCEGLDWGGSSDWGLPDPFELQTILDCGRGESPMIDPTVFPGTPSNWFWSSSSDSGNTTVGWAVYFAAGYVDFATKTQSYNARCVRRGPSPAPTPRFVRTVPVAEQPVVEDRRTGYVWQGCPAGLTGAGCSTGTVSTMNWQAALAYCEGLDWGGRTDWYLPNVVELRSIIDDSRTLSAIDTGAFPGTSHDRFWSSTSCSGLSSWAYYVSISRGSVYIPASKSHSYSVRCVRRSP